MKERYYHKEVGYNFRMTDIHAAIGLTQLNRLESLLLSAGKTLPISPKNLMEW
jgi:dTDP-4-amino-4,6-dideoxygalactose transaminase